jgi:Bacterial SH3 domain
MVSEARWTVTETLPGRERPDAAETPSGRVEAGSRLLELERLGLWVRVETPDQGRFWVDGRRLVEIAPAPGDRSPAATAPPTEASAQPIAPPPVQPAAPVWAASHKVPHEGLQAWAQPDPTGAIVANLAAGVELQVQERRADWAHVVAQNGWQGWVDGRRLVVAHVVAASPPPPASAAVVADDKALPGKAASLSIRSVAAVAVVLTIFLPWFRYGRYFGSGDATDVPAAFLWTLYPDTEFPNMGTVMMVLGAAVLAAEFVDRVKPYRRTAAWTTVVVAAVYLVQLFRAFMENEGDLITATSTMFTEGFAIGPWVTLAAGIVLLVKQPEASPS